MATHFVNKKKLGFVILILYMLLFLEKIEAQMPALNTEWIRPVNDKALQYGVSVMV
jgi:hypothetical protein